MQFPMHNLINARECTQTGEKRPSEGRGKYCSFYIQIRLFKFLDYLLRNVRY
jgi:hypothetical protein